MKSPLVLLLVICLVFASYATQSQANPINTTHIQSIVQKTLASISDFGLSANPTCGSSNTTVYPNSKVFTASDITGTSYRASLCHTVEESECKAKQGALCSYKNNALVSTLASWTKEPAPSYALISSTDPSKGVVVDFKNGDVCNEYWKEPAEVTMKVVCATTESVVISLPYSCSYIMTITSPAACAPSGGDSPGLSGGAIFLIIVAGLFVVYIIAGCLVCHFKFGQPFGLASLPNRAFWFALPGLFIAGIHAFIASIGRLIAKIKGNGSSTISTSEGEYEEV